MTPPLNSRPICSEGGGQLLLFILIYRVESDFGGIYRVAVYIGSVAPKGPLRGIYRVYIMSL